MDRPGEITRLLKLAGDGDDAARQQLAARVYEDLERIAAGSLRRRFGPRADGLTLEPSALVNETFLKLLGRDYPVGNRREFFALATTVMLNVLVDYQRRKAAEKRGGDRVRLTLGAVDGRSASAEAYEVSDLALALERLAELNPRHAEALRLKAVWGFSNAEIGEIIGISLATVERDLRFARAWLAAELRP